MKRRTWPVVMLTLIAGVANAAACECAKRQTPQQALADSTVVMEAYVLEKGNTLADLTSYRVSVSKVWKGEQVKEATVHTRSLDVTCTGELEVEKNYLLYLKGDNLETDACSRTYDEQTRQARLNYQEDLAAFKKAKK